MATSSHETDVTSILEAMAIEIRGLRSRVGTLENTEIIPGKVKDPSGVTTNGLTSGSTANSFVGNVGIGTTAPGYILDVRAAQSTFGLQSTTGTNYVNHRFQNQGGTMSIGIENSAAQGLMLGDTAYAGVINRQDASPLQFGTSNTVRMTIDSSGNVGIGTIAPLSELCINGGLHVGGDSDAGDNNLLVDGTTILTGLLTLTGGQLAFPAAQNASADANTLDDYEEGTWTPEVKFGGSSTGVTFTTTPLGTYTKIGRIVVAKISFTMTSNGSGVGATTISLPFTSLADGTPQTGTFFPFTGITFTDAVYPRTDSNAAFTALYDNNGGAYRVLTDTQVTDSAAAEFTLTYIAA